MSVEIAAATDAICFELLTVLIHFISFNQDVIYLHFDFGCRGWRFEGAADARHFYQSFANFTREASPVPFSAVPHRGPQSSMVRATPSLPAAQPQRALHGWKPSCISAPR